jgi:hypothetical protein
VLDAAFVAVAQKLVVVFSATDTVIPGAKKFPAESVPTGVPVHNVFV